MSGAEVANAAGARWSAVSAQRFSLVVVSLCGVWIIEAIVTRGPLESGFGGAWPAIASALIFGGASLIGVNVAGRRGMSVESGGDLYSFVGTARWSTICALIVAGVANMTGAASYDPVLQNFAVHKSILGLIWSPAVIGASALMLSVRTRLRWVDLTLLVALGVVAAISGGRTTPGLMVIMAFLRSFIYSGVWSSTGWHVGFKKYVLLAVVGIVAAGLFSAAAASRSNSAGAGTFSQESISANGYVSGPLFFRYVEATLGVIGESARVTHATVPERLGYAGPGLIGSDVFSFLPGFSATVTARTVAVFGAFGSIVYVSHPGGTPTTFYMLGGELWVFVGGLVYGFLIIALLRLARGGGIAVCAIGFYLIGATFILGAYGTGTPAGSTLLSLLYASVFLVIRRVAKRRRAESGVERGG